MQKVLVRGGCEGVTEQRWQGSGCWPTKSPIYRGDVQIWRGAIDSEARMADYPTSMGQFIVANRRFLVGRQQSLTEVAQ